MTEGRSHEENLIFHLTELRERVIKSALIIVIGSLGSWAISEKIFDIVRRPISPFLTGAAAGGLVFVGPMDKFVAHLQLSVLSGVILTAPFWLYQIWRFVAPGLYVHEKRFALSFIFAGTILFLLGVCFVYFLVFPMAFKYLLGFGGDLDKPMITISEYLSFFVTTTAIFGGAFELPLVISLLGLMGIVNRQFLVEKRRYAVVLLALVSAVVTPPDILSMCLLLIPLWILYEISIIIVGIFEKKRVRT